METRTTVRLSNSDTGALPAKSVPASPYQPTSAEQAAKLGDWFRHDVHRYDGQLKAYLTKTFPGIPDVDDVVQESYLRIWKARLRHPIRFAKSFLFQVARHVAIDAIRKKSTAGEESAVDIEALPVSEERVNPAAVLTHQEKIDLLSDAMAALPDRCREIIILRKFQSIPQKQVAARLCISERTVEDRLARGMRLCERYLQQRGIRGFIADER